uniref:Nck-associated protein 5 C-terminal domain-containing protein n=1 Tax=Xiphophorus couchianus TaxID=32473 RepID=A0A3B5MV33_9TELE
MHTPTQKKLIHELEEERRLRLESEKRLREVTEESELGRAQMVSLQQQFSRMEETVRSLLQNQGGVLEQSAVDTEDIMKAYKVGHVSALENLPGSSKFSFNMEENSTLALENESQREQYERCLDEVSHHRLHRPGSDLREECLKLRTRVFDLEQQNRALSVLFQQRIKPASDLLLQVKPAPLGLYRGGCNVFVGRPSNMKTQTAKENSLASSLEEGLLTKHVARLKDINIPKIKLCSSFSCCCKKIQVISVLVKRVNLR